MTARFWTCATITAVSALVSASFSVAGLFGPSGSDIFERYAASRSIALLIAVLYCIGVLLADGHCCSGAGHDAGSRFRRPNRRSRTLSREHLRPFLLSPSRTSLHWCGCCVHVEAATPSQKFSDTRPNSRFPTAQERTRGHGIPGSLRRQWPLPPRSGQVADGPIPEPWSPNAPQTGLESRWRVFRAGRPHSSLASVGPNLSRFLGQGGACEEALFPSSSLGYRQSGHRARLAKKIATSKTRTEASEPMAAARRTSYDASFPARGGGGEKVLPSRRQTSQGSTPLGVEAQRPQRQSHAPSRFNSRWPGHGGRAAYPRAGRRLEARDSH